MIENKDYELIAHTEESEYWAIRILTGEFVETVLNYGAIALNEDADNMTFNFEVLETPNEMASPLNADLQIVAADILQDILTNQFNEGSIK